MINSDGTLYIERFYYPQDYLMSQDTDVIDDGIGATMILENKYLPAWKTEKYTTNTSAGNLYDGVKTTWGTFAGINYPDTLYRYEHTWNENGNVAPGSTWAFQSAFTMMIVAQWLLMATTTAQEQQIRTLSELQQPIPP